MQFLDKKQRVYSISLYYINTDEIPGELSRENMMSSHVKIKNLFMLSVRISSYGCTREVWRARKMRRRCASRDSTNQNASFVE